MRAFVYTAAPCRVIFGAGSLAHVERELALLGITRALIIATPGQRPQAQAFAQRLGGVCAGVCAQAQMHVPVAVVRSAVEQVHATAADGVVALGGGSTIGLAKMLAPGGGSYFEMPEETARARRLVPYRRPWHLNADGYLYFVDRKKDTIRRAARLFRHGGAAGDSLGIPMSPKSPSFRTAPRFVLKR